MYFQHSAPIWRDFPALVPAVLYADGITGDAPVGPAADRFAAIAKSRLAAVAAESELPEIQAAWSITPRAAVLTATSPRFTPGA